MKFPAAVSTVRNVKGLFILNARVYKKIGLANFPWIVSSKGWIVAAPRKKGAKPKDSMKKTRKLGSQVGKSSLVQQSSPTLLNWVRRNKVKRIIDVDENLGNSKDRAIKLDIKPSEKASYKVR